MTPTDTGPSAASDRSRATVARTRYATATVVVGAALLAIKLFAAARTGSTAILADALESIVNVVAAIFVSFAVRWAHQPADEDHPFGHGRIEALSAGLEGALLLAAAAGIVWAALPALAQPRALEAVGLGLGLVAFATVVNAALGTALVRAGRAHRSMALVADGKHLLGDAATSVALLIGVGSAGVTGLWWIDPVVAVALGAWVAWTGLGVLRDSFASLMNEQSRADVDRVTKLLVERAPDGLVGAHDLRILDGGMERFVHLHVVVRPECTLADAHRIAGEVEGLLRDAFDGPVTPSVKVEPAADGQAGGIDLTRLHSPVEPRSRQA